MKADKLSSFALVIAAIILLVVGAISYRDYLKAKYEKEFGVANAQAAGAPQAYAPVPPQPQVQVNPAAPVPALPPAANNGQVYPPAIPGNPQTNAAAAPASARSPIQAAAESRMSRYQQDLKTLQQENDIYRKKLEATRNGVPLSPQIPAPNLPGIPNRPSSAVAAVPNAPGEPAPPAGIQPATPAPLPQQLPSPQTVAKEVSALSEKIRKEASVAKVIEFDPDWAFLIINGGRDRGIESDMRFAVRRGSEILGWIKITEVEAATSVAQLMSGNKDSKTARKPAPGDDIIAFNLF